ncbi:major facilitator superfamily MFS_1 [Methanocorpusculum labreanum Z]|uniref:Major facilitator superfamily MFS_1 n=1 Tax=Methanocorpusculum labreanum (strain ATCC 43576 / DSM 4855 / Z) TaxID=410358 RepID=A2SQG0_METLZ|nr:MFS transporter [Methanocorpusculum labreanum]ABN06566.1 major facilitator superfamily MFS_1 [Methanocorpusculum labreanum Z]
METLRLSAKQYIIAITVGIACFLPPFIGEATNIALPNMLVGLGYTMGADYWNLYGWILTVYLLTSTIFLIPAARLADKFSKKWFFSIGVLLLGVGSLGVGMSTSGEMVLAMRTIEGIGNALMFGSAIALLASAVKVELRGTAIGIAMTGVFLGQLAGPLLAGALTDVFGWSMVYLILCPVALLSFFLAIPFIPRDQPTDKGPYDWIGALLFMGGMGFALYGFSKQPNTEALALLVSGIFLLIAFFFYEKRNKNPLIPVKLILRNRGFTFNNSANLLYYVAIYAMGSLVSLYMTNVWGITDALPRALIVTTQGLILVLFTIVAGRFYDHLLPRWLLAFGVLFTIGGIAGAWIMGVPSTGTLWLIGAILCASVAAFGLGSLILAGIDRYIKNAPPKYATTTGLILISIGMIILLTCGTETAIWSMIAVQAFFGVGIAIFVTPNSTAIMNSVTPQEFGMASGTLSTTRMLGMAISIGIVSILKNIFLSGTSDDYAASFLQMMDGTIIAALVVLVLAMIFSWTAGSRRRI